MFIADTHYYLVETIDRFKNMTLDNYVEVCKKYIESKKSTLTENENIRMNRKIENIQLEQIDDILCSLMLVIAFISYVIYDYIVEIGYNQVYQEFEGVDIICITL